MAKPAVPFGGKYRIIDFTLSNCVNSGIDTVGVLTQYQPLELNSYVGNGAPWDLDRSDGGVDILPPYVREGNSGEWYKGTANAIYQNMGYIGLYQPDYVLILSGDHIYKMDYSEMLAHHKKMGATCTISVIEVAEEDASRFGIMNVDAEDIIYEFEEKPRFPKSNLASMGVYIFTWSKLREYLIADEANPDSRNDFGADVIPAMLAEGERMAAFRFSGYWKDVGTIASLWEANMDLLAAQERGDDVLGDKRPIFTRSPVQPPHYTGSDACVSRSLASAGDIILGTVEDSVLFHSVRIGEGATVRKSILMPGAVVEDGATVEYAIVAEHARIGAGAFVGAAPEDAAEAARAKEITVVAAGACIPGGRVVPAGGMIDEAGEEVAAG